MRRTSFEGAACPIARTSDLIGDGWSPLIMREAASGVRRFEEFQRRLEIPRATLTARLDRLVVEAMLRRVVIDDALGRHEYRLTKKGYEFYPVLAAMWRWGSDWLYREVDDHGNVVVGQPGLMLVDAQTGAEVRPQVVDEHSGRPIDLASIRVRGRTGLHHDGNG